MLTDIEGPLEPPSAPFSSNNAPSIGSASDVSLSVNYIPAKFSASLLTGGSTRKRRGKTGDVLAPAVPKRGGGIEAFRSGEARMPGQGDEDYDGVTGGWLGGGTGKSTPKKLRWNKFKWILFLANILVSDVPLNQVVSQYDSSLFQVNDLLYRRTYLLPPHLVQYLEARRRYTRRQPP